MMLIAAFLVWYATGIAIGWVYLWTKYHQITVGDIFACIVSGILGPISLVSILLAEIQLSDNWFDKKVFPRGKKGGKR